MSWFIPYVYTSVFCVCSVIQIDWLIDSVIIHFFPFTHYSLTDRLCRKFFLGEIELSYNEYVINFFTIVTVRKSPESVKIWQSNIIVWWIKFWRLCDNYRVWNCVGLELQQTYIAGTLHYGVFSSRPRIPRGTKFGPFRGRIVNLSEIKTSADNSFMWEVCTSIAMLINRIT